MANNQPIFKFFQRIKTGSSVVELTIHEGRNHQVKKMFQAVGFVQN